MAEYLIGIADFIGQMYDLISDILTYRIGFLNCSVYQLVFVLGAVGLVSILILSIINN